MPQHRVAASAQIAAPAERVYKIIADYHHGHPRILPKPYFGSLIVERGGFGAGTVLDVQMRVMGRKRYFRGIVTEPEPGRVLVETYWRARTATSFTVESRDAGRWAQVTIATDTEVHDGILGAFERWLATRLLRPIYEKQLSQLAAVATGQT